jgi:tetratricopeptide (TPR) repeat protein
MSILLISLALAGAAAPPEAPAQPEQTIVVTGTPIRDTERALRECLARKCPPNEDINATLAHAENLFVAGRYQDARATTLASIGRNRRYGKTYPIDVSDLYRANSRIAAHLGEAGDYEISTSAMQRTLDEALQKSDPRLINAKIEWGDMYASLGRIDRARQVYQEAERKARSAGRPDLAGVARVRTAWLHQIEGDTWLTRQALTEIAADRSPNARLARLSALVLLARLDRKQGNALSSSALIDEMRGSHSRSPVLIFAPRIESTNRLAEGDNAEGMTGSTLNLMATDNMEDRWIDVGFWVTSDGRVSDAEILRSKGPLDWTKSLLRSISGRIYSPIEDSVYRVERYSYTSRWMNVTGTRIRQRSPNPRIEYVDLTAEPTAARTN